MKADINIYKLNIALFLRALMLLSPVLILFYNENGLNTGDLFFCQGIYFVCAILSDIPIGYFSNIKSRKNILLLAYFIFLGISILWLFFKGYYIILIGEILYAITKTIVDNIPPSYLCDYLNTKNFKMTKEWGYSVFAMFGGTAIGSIFGAYLYSLFGSKFILIFEIIITVISIYLLFSLPNIKSSNVFQKDISGINNYLDITKKIYNNKKIMYYIFYSGLLQAYSVLFALSFQPLMKNGLFPVILFGIVTGSNHLIRAFASFITGKWLGNIKIKTLILPLFLLYILAFSFIFIIIHNESILINFLLMFAICLIIGVQVVFLVLHVSRIQKLVEFEQRGSLMTINNIIARTLPAIILIISRLFMNNAELGLNLFFVIMFAIFITYGYFIMIKTYRIED